MAVGLSDGTEGCQLVDYILETLDGLDDLVSIGS